MPRFCEVMQRLYILGRIPITFPPGLSPSLKLLYVALSPVGQVSDTHIVWSVRQCLRMSPKRQVHGRHMT